MEPIIYLMVSALLAFIFCQACITYLKSRLTRRSPPGPWGLPFVGNLPFLEPELHTYFARLANTYGPVLKLMLGSKVGFVISSPSGARQVLKEHDATFANRDIHLAAVALTYGGSDIVSAPYGPKWRMLRRICVLKMLSRPTLDSVYGLRRREVRDTVSYLYDRPGLPVNVGEQLFLTVYNVITSMLWGGSVQGEERVELGPEFKNVVSELTALVEKPNVSDFYPGLARFDLQGIVKRIKVLASRFDGIFDTMIDQRLRIIKKHTTPKAAEEIPKAGERDFLQFLLELKDEEESKTPLTTIGIKALLMNMIINGTETSSNTVEFILAEMLNQPHILKRAQQELDEVVGKDGVVEEYHISKLQYLKAVMKESLRLHSPAPLLVPHSPTEDSTIDGYFIPKGARVFVNVWAIHRDPTLWKNPTKFDPERFLNSELDYNGSDFSYIPFGSGRRMCAGMAMAERMVMYSLATLVHSFDWKLQEGEKLDLSEQFGIVLKKKEPLIAIPTPRLSNPALYK